jgi:ligand-binding SRPBCC domain-containing protein
MTRRTFEKESRIKAPAQEVFDWHKTDEALEKLIPPSDPVSVKSRSGGIKDGATVTLRIQFLGPLGMDWIAHHQNYEEGRQFEDVQKSGPFKYWCHTHIVEPVDDEECLLRDHVEYELPFGWLADFLAGWFVRRKLQSMFDYRHQVTREELEGE